MPAARRLALADGTRAYGIRGYACPAYPPGPTTNAGCAHLWVRGHPPGIAPTSTYARGSTGLPQAEEGLRGHLSIVVPESDEVGKGRGGARVSQPTSVSRATSVPATAGRPPRPGGMVAISLPLSTASMNRRRTWAASSEACRDGERREGATAPSW